MQELTMRGAIPPHALMARSLGPGQLHIRLSTAFVQCRNPDAAATVQWSGLTIAFIFCFWNKDRLLRVQETNTNPVRHTHHRMTSLHGRSVRLLWRLLHRLQPPSAVPDYSNLSLASLQAIIKSLGGGIQLVTRIPRQANKYRYRG